MKILVVSDDLLFARLTRKKLVNWGYDVTIEATGTGALNRIKREPYRIVVTGWDIKGLNGPALCAGIRGLNRSRYTYIIFYTAKTDKDSMIAALEAGADEYLVRPLNVVELKLTIRNAKRLLNLEDELREGAGTDSVTGLVNYASFRQFFRVVLAETLRIKERGALMYIHADDYNQLLEEHGFGPAETLIVDLSRTLSRVTRTSDLVARISENEFCMLLQNTYWDRCRPVADKARGLIDNMTLYLEDFELRPKVTIGTVNYPVENLSSDETLRISNRIPYAP